jgi:hypothetical protein
MLPSFGQAVSGGKPSPTMGGRSKGGATFQNDNSRELLFFSMHPNGYLKRMK